ncbi:MAG TPA: hypothetical protein VFL91_21790 [Thermomicrobiales bacterium]|nr:hypothetical protein [Thermomicrobiales bacterium]
MCRGTAGVTTTGALCADDRRLAWLAVNRVERPTGRGVVTRSFAGATPAPR